MSITLYELAAADPAIRFSPYVWRTRFCLLHKGLAFKGVPWRFTEKDALAPTGQGRVPAIVDHARGDRWVHDSWQIATYLDETHSDRPAIMANDAERASGRLTAVWAETAVHGAAMPLIIGNLFAHLDPKDQPYFRQSREERFGRTLEQIAVEPKAGVAALKNALAPAEAALAVSPFLSGSAPGYADYALAGSLIWIWITAPVLPIDPETAVGRWYETMLDLYDGHARKAKLMR
jgi:glutathione S-transferase